MGKNEKNLKKKSFGFRKENFGSETDTEIGPLFRVPDTDTEFRSHSRMYPDQRLVAVTL